jgi:hypothetical protein
LAGVERIDYFSIDVEGAEMTVLNTMDWNIPVHVITIETNKFEFAHAEKLLKEKGFELDERFFNLFHTQVWVNKKNARR